MAKAGISRLVANRVLIHFRFPLLHLKRKLLSRKSELNPGFFDPYPCFFSTSKTSATPNRLNKRHQVLIESNRAKIRDKSVLDLASHDGRWSLAAYQAGASRVLGIEARRHLVEFAEANMREYRVPEDQVHFVLGDLFQELSRLEPGTFETVFCFGFFYHTLHHMILLSEIARLRPNFVILDTAIDVDPGSFVEVHQESVATESAGAMPDPGDPGHILVGVPTRAALEMMLSSSGFTFSYCDWRKAGIKRWDGLADYHEGRRISLVANLTRP